MRRRQPRFERGSLLPRERSLHRSPQPRGVRGRQKDRNTLEGCESPGEGGVPTRPPIPTALGRPCPRSSSRARAHAGIPFTYHAVCAPRDPGAGSPPAERGAGVRGSIDGQTRRQSEPTGRLRAASALAARRVAPPVRGRGRSGQDRQQGAVVPLQPTRPLNPDTLVWGPPQPPKP